MTEEHLAAVCGLYCGACSLYRASHDHNLPRLEEILQNMSSRRKTSRDDLYCAGCLSQGQLTSHCLNCAIRLCPSGKPGVARCADCPDFPCSRITDFNNDSVRHHAEVLDNIRRMQKIGVKEWLNEQEEKWRCSLCGVSVEWYAQHCFRCGTSQPRRLPSLPKDKA